MNRPWILAGLFVASAVVLTALPATARDRRDPLGDLLGYVRLADPKAELAARTLSLSERVKRSERRGDLRRKDADDLQDRLTRVRDFLRDDRKLTKDEFKRRDGDLDRIERDLDDKARRER
jgi:hypothetical protein